MNQDRRIVHRQAIELSVEYKRLNTFFADYTRNISKGGTFIRTERPLDVKTEFVFALTIRGLPEPLRLRGRVKWIVDHGGRDAELACGDGHRVHVRERRGAPGNRGDRRKADGGRAGRRPHARLLGRKSWRGARDRVPPPPGLPKLGKLRDKRRRPARRGPASLRPRLAPIPSGQGPGRPAAPCKLPCKMRALLPRLRRAAHAAATPRLLALAAATGCAGLSQTPPSPRAGRGARQPVDVPDAQFADGSAPRPPGRKADAGAARAAGGRRAPAARPRGAALRLRARRARDGGVVGALYLCASGRAARRWSTRPAKRRSPAPSSASAPAATRGGRRRSCACARPRSIPPRPRGARSKST